MQTPKPASSPVPGGQIQPATYIDWTVELVANFVRNNATRAAELPDLIASTYSSLKRLDTTMFAPAIPIEQSVHDDYLVCLEDGKKLKSLRRHLQRAFNMSPDDYRRKWHLPEDYPFVAPAYSRERSEIARRGSEQLKERR